MRIPLAVFSAFAAAAVADDALVVASALQPLAEERSGYGGGHGGYGGGGKGTGTACVVKGSYCNCHYCKCESGNIHCGGHGHGGGYGKKYCYGSMEGEYCHCDYCKCKNGFGLQSKGYGGGCGGGGHH